MSSGRRGVAEVTLAESNLPSERLEILRAAAPPRRSQVLSSGITGFVGRHMAD